MGSKTAWRPPDCGTLWGESPEKARGSVKLAGLGESIPEVWRLCRDLPLAGVQLLGEGGGRRPPERLEENPSCSGVQARQGGGERPVLLENTLRHAARGREGHVTSRGEGGGEEEELTHGWHLLFPGHSGHGNCAHRIIAP